MFKRVGNVDALVAGTGRAWRWLGQLGLVVLGVHLAADRLDDMAWGALGALPVGSSMRATAAAWAAVALELLVVARAASALLLTPMAPPLSRARWWRARSVDAFVLPVFWAIVALAGAWSLAMGLEDLMSGWQPQLARALAWSGAVLVAWRLGWSGWRRVVGSLEPGGPLWRGALWALPMLAVTSACAVHGLPLWGWLS